MYSYAKISSAEEKIEMCKENKNTESELYILYKMLHQYSEYFKSHISESSLQRKRYMDNGYYGFIPNNNIYSIIKAFVSIKNTLLKETNIGCTITWNDYKFLDAGCGIGNIMLLAKVMGFNSSGIEIDKELIQTANILLNTVSTFPLFRGEIFNKDILTFKKYSDYNIIYYYCPFHNHKKQIKFELMVEEQMKVGAFLIPFSKASYSFIRKEGCKFESIYGIGAPLYRKTIK